MELCIVDIFEEKMKAYVKNYFTLFLHEGSFSHYITILDVPCIWKWTIKTRTIGRELKLNIFISKF